eukprot:6031489-Amphidinium_carterae.1
MQKCLELCPNNYLVGSQQSFRCVPTVSIQAPGNVRAGYHPHGASSSLDTVDMVRTGPLP